MCRCKSITYRNGNVRVHSLSEILKRVIDNLKKKSSWCFLVFFAFSLSLYIYIIALVCWRCTYLSLPLVSCLCNFLVGVTHHSDEHVHQKDCDDAHVYDEHQFGDEFVFSLLEGPVVLTEICERHQEHGHDRFDRALHRVRSAVVHSVRRLRIVERQEDYVVRWKWKRFGEFNTVSSARGWSPRQYVRCLFLKHTLQGDPDECPPPLRGTPRGVCERLKFPKSPGAD